MKKVVMLLTAVGILTLLAGGIASAVDKRCDGGRCVGTKGEDYLLGSDGGTGSTVWVDRTPSSRVTARTT